MLPLFSAMSIASTVNISAVTLQIMVYSEARIQESTNIQKLSSIWTVVLLFMVMKDIHLMWTLLAHLCRHSKAPPGHCIYLIHTAYFCTFVKLNHTCSTTVHERLLFMQRYKQTCVYIWGLRLFWMWSEYTYYVLHRLYSYQSLLQWVAVENGPSTMHAGAVIQGDQWEPLLLLCTEL